MIELTRENMLCGSPIKRARTLLFLIERRTARLVARDQELEMLLATPHEGAPTLVFLLPREEIPPAAGEEGYLAQFQEARRSLPPPTIAQIERYARDWAPLVPANPDLRAALARLLGEKYRLTRPSSPGIQVALGLENAAVQEAYERLYGESVEAIFAPRIGLGDRLSWLRDAVDRRLNLLPPFWFAFAFTLTENVGAGILALPIALAEAGPLAGVALLLFLGGISVLAVVCMAEAAARSEVIRCGDAFLGRLVADYLGKFGARCFTAGAAILSLLYLQVYAVGLSTVLAEATHVPPAFWTAALLAACLFFVSRPTLRSTATSALVVGSLNIALILLLSTFGFLHARWDGSSPTALTISAGHSLLPTGGGRPIDPSAHEPWMRVLGMGVGVVIAACFGCLSVGNCARLVLRRDPSARALIGGCATAQVVTTLLYCVFLIAITLSVGTRQLAGHSGTSLELLARVAGPAVLALGSLYVTLAMGMAAVHHSLGLFQLALERLPVRTAHCAPRTAGRAGGASAWEPTVGHSTDRSKHLFDRRLVAACPIVAAFLITEWLQLQGKQSFTGLLGFMGLILLAVLGGIFPVLLLAAGRRKGGLIPGFAWRLLERPWVLAGIYTLLLLVLVAHGLFIWESLPARALSLATAGLCLGSTLEMVRRGVLRARIVVELREEADELGRARLSLAAGGRPLPGTVQVEDLDGCRHVDAATGEIALVSRWRRLVVSLPPTPAREIKLWAHRQMAEGASEPLLAFATLLCGEEERVVDLTHGPVLHSIERPSAACQITFTSDTRCALRGSLI